ncbi:alpha/beta fold hydrolase [Paragemmobacter straminiformis]|uniref:Alpha/beta fold hydrolase n=1 Tax=Paragemmobacter straminiformis TaxID=2045119 RepID=A0A842ID44_9RHOB|nr:alpha/beta fold hydrolase [Gemmobacter straminiformis]MBC2837004.1 alpha/beta fold hydrolase [Gemmobacter straminiformis]
MPDLLLLHGACHGAWAWDAVIPALAARGLAARAIDLPACGADPTPAAQVTLLTTARAILKAATTPTILVAHSAAGFPATLAAGLDPSRITALVYLAAWVPAPDRSLADMRRAWPDPPLRHAFRLSPDRLTFTFDPDRAADLFFHDCPPDIAAAALSRLTPQPLATQETALPPNALPSNAFAPTALPPTTRATEAPPRHYIRTTADRAIPPALQTEMARGCTLTDLPTGHSPFLSAPEALAQRLAEIHASTLSRAASPR